MEINRDLPNEKSRPVFSYREQKTGALVHFNQAQLDDFAEFQAKAGPGVRFEDHIADLFLAALQRMRVDTAGYWSSSHDIQLAYTPNFLEEDDLLLGPVMAKRGAVSSRRGALL
jgi:hypothetical protein